jgi:hypothetical protein
MTRFSDSHWVERNTGYRAKVHSEGALQCREGGRQLESPDKLDRRPPTTVAPPKHAMLTQSFHGRLGADLNARCSNICGRIRTRFPNAGCSTSHGWQVRPKGYNQNERLLIASDAVRIRLNCIAAIAAILVFGVLLLLVNWRLSLIVFASSNFQPTESARIPCTRKAGSSASSSSPGVGNQYLRDVEKKNPNSFEGRPSLASSSASCLCGRLNEKIHLRMWIFCLYFNRYATSPRLALPLVIGDLYQFASASKVCARPQKLQNSTRQWLPIIESE